MTLFTSSFSTSIVLLALGLLFLVRRNDLNAFVINFPRSSKLSYIFITIGLLWFLYRHVSNLSEADFGNYNNYLEVASADLDLRVAQHYRYNKTYVNNVAVGYGGAGVTYWTGSYADAVPTLDFNVIGSIYN